MDNRKYIGMDVHQASISITVSDAAGKVLMESIIETKAGTVLEFIQGLRGSLWVDLVVSDSRPHIAVRMAQHRLYRLRLGRLVTSGCSTRISRFVVTHMLPFRRGCTTGRDWCKYSLLASHDAAALRVLPSDSL